MMDGSSAWPPKYKFPVMVYVEERMQYRDTEIHLLRRKWGFSRLKKGHEGSAQETPHRSSQRTETKTLVPEQVCRVLHRTSCRTQAMGLEH